MFEWFKERFSRETPGNEGRLDRDSVLGEDEVEDTTLGQDSAKDRARRENEERKRRKREEDARAEEQEKQYWRARAEYQADPEGFRREYESKTGKSFYMPPKSPKQYKEDALKFRKRGIPEEEREMGEMGIPHEVQEYEKVWIQSTKEVKDKEGNVIRPATPGHYEFAARPKRIVSQGERLLTLKQIKTDIATEEAGAAKMQLDKQETENELFRQSRKGKVLGAARSAAWGAAQAFTAAGAGAGRAMTIKPSQSVSRLYMPSEAPNLRQMRSRASDALVPGMNPAGRELAPGMNTAGAMMVTGMNPAGRAIGQTGVNMPYPQVTSEGVRSGLTLPSRKITLPQAKTTLPFRKRKTTAQNRYKSEVARIRRARPNI
jgi:hypothetical protein